MRMVGYPMALPAKCIECGYGGADRTYADTGLDIDFYGVVYLCDLCLHHWFEQLNYDGFEKLKDEVESYKKTVGSLISERDNLLRIINHIEYFNHGSNSSTVMDGQQSIEFTNSEG